MIPGKPDRRSEDLSAYLDGELPEERARQVERWLTESDECRQTLEQLRQVSDHLGSLPRYRAPDELTAAMRRAAERRALLDDRQSASGGRVLRLGVRVTAAAAVAAACFLAGWQVAKQERRSAVPYTAADEAVRPPPVTPQAPGHVAGRGTQGLGERAVATSDDLPRIARTEPEMTVAGRFAFDGRAVPAAVPVVEVGVTPRSADEYAAVRAVLATWVPATQEPKTDLDGEMLHLSRAKAEESAAPSLPLRFEWNVSSGEAMSQIGLLEQQAPQNVRVTVSVPAANLAQVQQLVLAAGAQQTDLSALGVQQWARPGEAADPAHPASARRLPAPRVATTLPPEPRADSPEGGADKVHAQAAVAADTVTLRVTLLPPVTSQPTSAPSGP